MTEQEKATLKRRFRTAQKLIVEERYDAARHVLEQIDHPQAQVWLQKIEGKASKPASTAPISGMMVISGLGAIVLVIGLILAILYGPDLIEAIQPNTHEQYLDDTYVSDEEILYASVADYCYRITGYGGELCLDWADLLMADYRPVVNQCFEPYLSIAILEEADYATIGICLSESAIPPPY